MLYKRKLLHKKGFKSFTTAVPGDLPEHLLIEIPISTELLSEVSHQKSVSPLKIIKKVKHNTFFNKLPTGMFLFNWHASNKNNCRKKLNFYRG